MNKIKSVILKALYVHVVLFTLGMILKLDKNCWETPDELFQKYNDIWRYEIDAAANTENHKLPKWFGPGSLIGVEDALTIRWREWGCVFWLNPPYGRGLLAPFLQKATEEWNRDKIFITLLLPVDTSTGWWHDWIQPHVKYNRVEFLKGRIKFKGATGSPKFGSCILHL